MWQIIPSMGFTRGYVHPLRYQVTGAGSISSIPRSSRSASSQRLAASMQQLKVTVSQRRPCWRNRPCSSRAVGQWPLDRDGMQENDDMEIWDMNGKNMDIWMEISMDLMGHNGYHHYQMDVNGRIKSIDGLFISLSLYHYHYNPLDIICEWEIKHKTYIYLRWCLKIYRFTD